MENLKDVVKEKNQNERNILKGIRDLYNNMYNYIKLKQENSLDKRVKTAEKKIITINDRIFEFKTSYKNVIHKYYDIILKEYQISGNRRKILSELNRETTFQRNLNSLFNYYNVEMNQHKDEYLKVEMKLNVLEDEKQFFKKNWKNKFSEYEKRIQELNKTLELYETLKELDSEIKEVIHEQLSDLNEIKNTLKPKYEEINKVKLEDKKLIYNFKKKHKRNK